MLKYAGSEDYPPDWLIKRIRKQHKKRRKKSGMIGAQFLEEGRYGDPRYKHLPINPHPHTTKQLNKMTKKGLIRLVVKLEKFILNTVYQMYKSKLPRLRTIRQKALPKPKTKRKFSRKQLAAQRLFAKRARAGTLRRR